RVEPGFIRITNLDDGSWWNIRTNCDNTPDLYCIHSPLVLTCDEMFAQYGLKNPEGSTGNSLLRISIDALGPPNPALPPPDP
ncbi:MAG: hypothetical protein AAGA56_13890, partial [Myxococcota bacterium]